MNLGPLGVDTPVPEGGSTGSPLSGWSHFWPWPHCPHCPACVSSGGPLAPAGCTRLGPY